MPREQRRQQDHAEQEPTAAEAPNPFTDSSFLVTPTIGHSTLAAPRGMGAGRRMANQTDDGISYEVADETPDDPTSQARTTLVLPPFNEPTQPTDAAAGSSQPGARRTRPPTGTPQRDSQRALVSATDGGQRQLATRPTGEAATALLIRGARRAPRTFGTVVPRRRGPTSFLAQFIVTMATSVILFSVLTLATPLGQGAVFGSAFQAYANAIPIIPTATPTPQPTATPLPFAPPGGYNPGQTAIINMIIAVFGPYAQGALAVSRCESGYDPNAVNPYAIGNSHASGVFQILFPSTWDTTSYSGNSPFDASANIHAAYQIFSRDGNSWREWACQP